MKIRPIKRIVITGPESSGKTTLIKRISEHLVVNWVPEFARIYLEEKKDQYQESDLKKIAQGQIRSEETFLKNANQFLICDTDLITLKIWSEYKYGRCDQFILKNIEARPYDLYLLCSPDIPWEPDPLREHPKERFKLYELYKKELLFYHKPFVEIQGSSDQRLKQALENIHALIF